MIKTNHRLNRIVFDTVFKSGKVSHSPTFLKKTLVLDTWKDYGVSVVVSKKIAKNAVDRNRIKRRVYSVVREVIESAKTPQKAILILKKNPKNLSRDELRSELEHIFKS